jgi:hypothetical protein
VTRPSTKILPPLPPEFAVTFVKQGWRGIERIYGQRTDRLLKWREIAGGDRLDALRRRYMGGDKSALGEVAP